jgi:hypothetical protein
MHLGYWWVRQKERDHLEDHDVGRWIILRWILERQDGMLQSALVWLRIGSSYYGASYLPYVCLQEQEHNNTGVKAVAEPRISTVELNILTLTNKTEPALFNNETETNLTKIEPEIIFVNNIDNERSDTENLMESVLNKTQTGGKEILVLVPQDCNKTEWNQSDAQIRQQQTAVNVQETHKYKNNISNTQELNMADHHRNGLHKNEKTMSEGMMEDMETVSLESSKNINRMSTNDLHQDDKEPEPDMSHTLSPLIERNDGTIPIRVILHSPHEHHHENGIVSEHEYIVLQTGNPAYHGHLEKTQIPGQEAPGMAEKGLDTTEADKQKSHRKIKGRKNHVKLKISTQEIRNTTESHEERSAEKVYHNQQKGWKKHNSEEATDTHEDETSTEDIRKHGNHQNSIKPSHNNTIHIHKGKGRHFHKPGQFYKKHKLIKTAAAENINETVSKELTMKDKQPNALAAEGRNETSGGVIIKSKNQKNSSADITKKDEIHRRRPAGKKTKYQHHRTSVNEKLNGNRNDNTSTLNVSSAQYPPIPLSTVRHKAHTPIGEHNVDDDFNGNDDSREENPTEFTSKQGDTPKAENLRILSINIKNSTDISADELNSSKQITECSGIHNEGHVKASDLRKPNAGHVTDEPNSSSREDSSDSEAQGENIIKHYSKLLKWIDYPL